MAIFSSESFGHTITKREPILGGGGVIVVDYPPPYLLIVVTVDPLPSPTTSVTANGIELTRQPFDQPSTSPAFTEYFQVWTLENAPSTEITVFCSPNDRQVEMAIYADASFVKVVTDEESDSLTFDFDGETIEDEPFFEMVFKTTMPDNPEPTSLPFDPSTLTPTTSLPGPFIGGGHRWVASGYALLGGFWGGSDWAFWAFWNLGFSYLFGLWTYIWFDRGPAPWATPYELRDPTHNNNPSHYEVEESTSWFGLRVLVGPPRFIPFPCAAVYLDFEDVTTLSDNDEVGVDSLPELGATTQPHYWGTPAEFAAEGFAPQWYGSGGPNGLAYLHFNFGEGPQDFIQPAD